MGMNEVQSENIILVKNKAQFECLYIAIRLQIKIPLLPILIFWNKYGQIQNPFKEGFWTYCHFSDVSH